MDEDDEVQVTPLDSALMAEQSDMVEVIISHHGLTITRIHNIAATRIQAFYRGYRIRTSFNDRKRLFVKHEQLREKKRRSKGRAREGGKKAGEAVVEKGRRRRAGERRGGKNSLEAHLVAGHFLGKIVEEHQRSSYVKRVPVGEDKPLPGDNNLAR